MLSQIASNFEISEVQQLAFTYKPTLSNYQTTDGQVGTIMMATQYNPNAGVWTNKEQFLAQTGATSSRVTDLTYHGVECDVSKLPNDGKLFNRSGPPILGSNLTDYDLGYTQIRIQDVPTASIAIGELHVSYTVKLSKPRLYSNLAFDQMRDTFLLNRQACS